MRGGKRVLMALVTLMTVLGGIYLPDSSSPQAGNMEGPSGMSLYGRVVSQYGPVENARVRIAGSNKYALTDWQWRFEIMVAYLPGTSFLVTAR